MRRCRYNHDHQREARADKFSEESTHARGGVGQSGGRTAKRLKRALTPARSPLCLVSGPPAVGAKGAECGLCVSSCGVACRYNHDQREALVLTQPHGLLPFLTQPDEPDEGDGSRRPGGGQVERRPRGRSRSPRCSRMPFSERQNPRKQHCGLHAANALVGCSRFTQADFLGVAACLDDLESGRAARGRDGARPLVRSSVQGQCVVATVESGCGTGIVWASNRTRTDAPCLWLSLSSLRFFSL